MTQEQQQVNVVDWLIEQLQQRYDALGHVDPFTLIDLKYEAKKMYYTALHDEFKRGLDMGNDIAKKIWGDK